MKKINTLLIVGMIQLLSFGAYANGEKAGAGHSHDDAGEVVESDVVDPFMESLNKCDGNAYYDRGEYIEALVFDIKENSDECVKKIYDANKYLVINFGSGGDTRGAFKIGSYLYENQKKIVIRKACMSACFLMVSISDNSYLCDKNTTMGYHKAIITDPQFKNAEDELNKMIKSEIKSKMNKQKISEFETFEDTSYGNFKMLNGQTSVDMGFVEGFYCPAT